MLTLTEIRDRQDRDRHDKSSASYATLADVRLSLRNAFAATRRFAPPRWSQMGEEKRAELRSYRRQHSEAVRLEAQERAYRAADLARAVRVAGIATAAPLSIAAE